MTVVSVKKVPVACPKCGHQQLEPPSAYSTACRQCSEYFLVQESLHPVVKPAIPAIEVRVVRCFQCRTELEVAPTAASTMCKRCSCHVDLADYHISGTVSKSFRTYGRFVVEEKGYVLNTEAHVGEAVIKGQVIGRIVAEGTLELHSTARIKGTFDAGRLVIPAGQQFCWPTVVQVRNAEIAGELVANIHAPGCVLLKTTARLFGHIQAAGLIVEAGAVFVGSADIRPQSARPR